MDKIKSALSNGNQIALGKEADPSTFKPPIKLNYHQKGKV